jgi:hypothetical protein
MHDLTDKELYAVDYLYGVGTEDVEIECRSLGRVRTRIPTEMCQRFAQRQHLHYHQ